MQVNKNPDAAKVAGADEVRRAQKLFIQVQSGKRISAPKQMFVELAEFQRDFPRVKNPKIDYEMISGVRMAGVYVLAPGEQKDYHHVEHYTDRNGLHRTTEDDGTMILTGSQVADKMETLQGKQRAQRTEPSFSMDALVARLKDEEDDDGEGDHDGDESDSGSNKGKSDDSDDGDLESDYRGAMSALLGRVVPEKAVAPSGAGSLSHGRRGDMSAAGSFGHVKAKAKASVTPNRSSKNLSAAELHADHCGPRRRGRPLTKPVVDLTAADEKAVAAIEQELDEICNDIEPHMQFAETQRHRDTGTQRHRDTNTQRHRNTERHRKPQRGRETHRDTKKDKETQGHSDTQTRRNSETETQRHRDTETHKHRDTQTQRYRDTGTQGHRDTETERHRDTETQRHRGTETQ